jgi:ketosteroid isomerase-like protein
MSNARPAIEAANKKLMAAIQRGDVTDVAQIYRSDVKVLPPYMAMLTGRKAAQAIWQGGIEMGIKEVILETTDVTEGGDVACETGKYTHIIQPSSGETITDKGKYLVVWKQEAGSWKIDTEIWNSSLPAPG